MNLISLFLGIAGAGLIAIAVWLYTPDKSRDALERAYGSPPSQFVTVAGTRLHLRDRGPPDAPALILMHGFGASLLTWEPWAEALSAQYRVVTFDLPGFGLSGPDLGGDYSDQRSLAVITDLMDHLGIARASLIGNSLGGRLAWMLAATRPERVNKLVLISPDGFASPGFDYGKPPAVPMVMRLLPYTLPTAMVRMSLAPAYGDENFLTDAMVTRYRDLMLAPGNRRAMIARMEQVNLPRPEPLLAHITAPTLLIWGEKDRMIPYGNARNYLSALPDARLISFADLGHLPQEEAPARSLAAVRAFLQQ